MKPTPTFYIFHGDDDIRREQALAKMRSAMGDDGDLNRSEFDGALTPVPEVLAAVKSFPFLSDKRLVIVKGLISHITGKGAGQAGKKARSRLIEELPNLPDYARLVMVETALLSDKNRLLKAIQDMERGYVSAFKKPRNLAAWIAKRAKAEYDADITPQAAQALASVVEDDLRRADNELYKLVCYVHDAHPIGENDVAVLTPYVPQANVFEMVDALAIGDGERALRLINQTLHDNPRDPGFGLFGLIARQFRLLLMVKDHLNRGGGGQSQTIAKALGVHPFVAGKVAQQSRDFTAAQLDAILKRLQKYDQDMKTGRIDVRLALDLLVTSLARK